MNELEAIARTIGIKISYHNDNTVMLLSSENFIIYRGTLAEATKTIKAIDWHCQFVSHYANIENEEEEDFSS